MDRRGLQMKHTGAFSRCHPLVLLVYFVLVLTITMISLHPVMLGLSLAAGLWFYGMLQGKKAFRFFLRVVLPVALLAAVCNPLFTHRGVTMLCRLPSGNPLTLESILYGLGAGAMLGAALVWFACCTQLLTTDKLLYLFGRILPGLSLLLSMILRFVPAFSRQLGRIREAQRGLGASAGTGLRSRVRSGLSTFSILVTWALEHALETADSMKSRGFGLPGRTAFSVYRLTGQDVVMLLLEALPGGYMLFALFSGVFSFSYYPAIAAGECGLLQITGFLAYTILLLLPMLLDRREARLWQTMKYRI